MIEGLILFRGKKNYFGAVRGIAKMLILFAQGDTSGKSKVDVALKNRFVGIALIPLKIACRSIRGTTRRMSAISAGRSSRVAGRIRMFSVFTIVSDSTSLHNPKPLAHEALEAWPPDEVIGEFLAGEHGQRGLPAVGDHLRRIVDRQRASCAITCITMFIIICSRRISFCSSARSSALIATTSALVSFNSIDNLPPLSTTSLIRRTDNLMDSAVPAQQKCSQAKLIRSVQLNPSLRDPLDHFIPGVPKCIPPSHRNHRILRSSASRNSCVVEVRLP